MKRIILIALAIAASTPSLAQTPEQIAILKVFSMACPPGLNSLGESRLSAAVASRGIQPPAYKSALDFALGDTLGFCRLVRIRTDFKDMLAIPDPEELRLWNNREWLRKHGG